MERHSDFFTNSSLFATTSLEVTGVRRKLPSPLDLTITSSPSLAAPKYLLWFALNSLALTTSISFHFNFWCKDTKRVPIWHTYKHILTRRKTCSFFTPSPQGGLSFFFLSFHFSQVDLVFIGRSPLKTKNRLVRNVFVRMSLYHARALCEGKSDKMAKD